MFQAHQLPHKMKMTPGYTWPAAWCKEGEGRELQLGEAQEAA